MLPDIKERNKELDSVYPDKNFKLQPYIFWIWQLLFCHILVKKKTFLQHDGILINIRYLSVKFDDSEPHSDLKCSYFALWQSQISWNILPPCHVSVLTGPPPIGLQLYTWNVWGPLLDELYRSRQYCEIKVLHNTELTQLLAAHCSANTDYLGTTVKDDWDAAIMDFNILAELWRSRTADLRKWQHFLFGQF